MWHEPADATGCPNALPTIRTIDRMEGRYDAEPMYHQVQHQVAHRCVEGSDKCAAKACRMDVADRLVEWRLAQLFHARSFDPLPLDIVTRSRNIPVKHEFELRIALDASDHAVVVRGKEDAAESVLFPKAFRDLHVPLKVYAVAPLRMTAVPMSHMHRDTGSVIFVQPDRGRILVKPLGYLPPRAPPPRCQRGCVQQRTPAKLEPENCQPILGLPDPSLRWPSCLSFRNLAIMRLEALPEA
mmetsp:Transcript_21811/g.60921  ORF Transcript_21811/g.60921 Transcript_21811/m.60921 type:complete len:241 (+) Transcript_21811:149-871(+)